MGVARHWLAIFNVAWALYVFLPFLAPILMQAGLTTPARGIYLLYSVLCHQLPDHSYFLFGVNPVPLQPELVLAGMDGTDNLLSQRVFIGNDSIGYKVALCQRDIAIYGSVFLAGIAFAFLRRRIKPMSFKIYLLFLIPIAVDGLTQLVGLRESNWWLRSLTGALFGAASVFFAYPYIDDAMLDVIETEELQQAARALIPRKDKGPEWYCVRFSR
ncbi:MAG: DUF2085 domain-containing protein [Caldilineaceae bacterium]|nr:DUF2085 domain-containing protein [Caldilineaceae bacterium]